MPYIICTQLGPTVAPSSCQAHAVNGGMSNGSRIGQSSGLRSGGSSGLPLSGTNACDPGLTGGINMSRCGCVLSTYYVYYILIFLPARAARVNNEKKRKYYLVSISIPPSARTLRIRFGRVLRSLGCARLRYSAAPPVRLRAWIAAPCAVSPRGYITLTAYKSRPMYRQQTLI